MSAIKFFSSVVLLAASSAVLAEPSLLVTMEKSARGGKALLSFDFVEDSSNPESAIRFAVDLKSAGGANAKALKPGFDAVPAAERASLEKRVSMGRCVEGIKAPAIGMCGVGTGDLIVLIDGTASKKGIASGQIGTATVPANLLELTADGKVKLAFVEFVKPETGEMAKGAVVGDAVK